MKKTYAFFILLAFCALLVFAGCEGTEKKVFALRLTVERATDSPAEVPLDKVRALVAKKLAEEKIPLAGEKNATAELAIRCGASVSPFPAPGPDLRKYGISINWSVNDFSSSGPMHGQGVDYSATALTDEAALEKALSGAVEARMKLVVAAVREMMPADAPKPPADLIVVEEAPDEPEDEDKDLPGEEEIEIIEE